MVRQHTTLSQRVFPQSPRAHKFQRPNQRSLQTIKSPLTTKLQFNKTGRASSRGGARYIRPKPLLPTIQEEDEEEYNVQHSEVDLYSELDAFGRDERDKDDDFMEWDEETTLVALFPDDVTETSRSEDFASLAEKLRAPMSAQSQQLKQYMADTVMPTLKLVKHVHDTLENEVNMAYGAGLLAFDEVCKRVEVMTLRTEDEMKSQYLESQRKVQKFMGELDEAYQHRAQLWVDLEEKLGSCAERAKAILETLPADVEDTIARLEKKSKEMEKNSSSTASKQKILRGLLERL